ncbi:hypothetical protein NCLIV_038070 [Neospora caninum Liverpool]|uniref:Uncharacterized protein n=1 Tax=Neospora caninum (strain Liverpool) TaxID=572307 RepID=F0VJW4_NEOCL|nr:hypothetical protein NCLIV_038070 [Neospora caninum Liverpool]CBZ54026.1 hypothetical protein NCLIV_038070 [Neospora caninum Liverpool]CEL68030.1 TPA: hypothetical protein BN1204_038070 [Neospora caninum Liverpool]|eukprot:XP_003884057.1 hypothetical protein NCLIV_038070 [Neospora caninum Liverpool]
MVSGTWHYLVLFTVVILRFGETAVWGLRYQGADDWNSLAADAPHVASEPAESGNAASWALQSFFQASTGKAANGSPRRGLRHRVAAGFRRLGDRARRALGRIRGRRGAQLPVRRADSEAGLMGTEGTYREREGIGSTQSLPDDRIMDSGASPEQPVESPSVPSPSGPATDEPPPTPKRPGLSPQVPPRTPLPVPTRSPSQVITALKETSGQLEDVGGKHKEGTDDDTQKHNAWLKTVAVRWLSEHCDNLDQARSLLESADMDEHTRKQVSAALHRGLHARDLVHTKLGVEYPLDGCGGPSPQSPPETPPATKPTPAHPGQSPKTPPATKPTPAHPGQSPKTPPATKPTPVPSPGSVPRAPLPVPTRSPSQVITALKETSGQLEDVGGKHKEGTDDDTQKHNAWLKTVAVRWLSEHCDNLDQARSLLESADMDEHTRKQVSAALHRGLHARDLVHTKLGVEYPLDGCGGPSPQSPPETPPATKPTPAHPGQSPKTPPATKPTLAHPGQSPKTPPATKPTPAHPGQSPKTPPATKPTPAHPGQSPKTPPATKPTPAHPGQSPKTPPATKPTPAPRGQSPQTPPATKPTPPPRGQSPQTPPATKPTPVPSPESVPRAPLPQPSRTPSEVVNRMNQSSTMLQSFASQAYRGSDPEKLRNNESLKLKATVYRNDHCDDIDEAKALLARNDMRQTESFRVAAALDRARLARDAAKEKLGVEFPPDRCQ